VNKDMSSVIDPGLFRETLGHYPTGVAVVTAVAANGQPAGMVVGTFSSVSLEPPLIAFFPARTSASFQHLRTASAFCVNVLAADQEQLCRQFATGGANKFDGVRWQPAPLGSPVLDDAVSWLECTFEQIQEAGDHYIVLGRVHELAVARPTLPLLFFQGGYGRFSTGSFVAAPDPELIQAAQLAELIRARVEELSNELDVNCGVLVKIRWDVVQVLAADRKSIAEAFPLGHRQPLVPPLGAAFLVNSTRAEIDAWLERAPDDDHARREVHRSRLDDVRKRGYTLLAADPERLQRQQTALSEFERSDHLPRHEHAVKQAIAELTDLYCPDLAPGELYDLESIVVPIPLDATLPPMAIRISAIPRATPTAQVEAWIARLQQVAAAAAATMTGRT
jgi:flavin reductase (DIM6/NTAB) family NADH-FMN oxidoreductase RutF